jgi:sulfur relay protein TusB/DsrH
MLVLIKSGPDTPEAKRAVRLAADLGADLVLVQSAVYLACEKGADLRGPVYAIDEDLRMRGIGPGADIGAAERIDYDRLADLIAQADQVHGAF